VNVEADALLNYSPSWMYEHSQDSGLQKCRVSNLCSLHSCMYMYV